MLLSLAFSLLVTFVTSRHLGSTDATTESIPNANHIFNAIHSSMRQWGSSWNHNGMSFFLATVPADTQFYHGTPESSKPVKGMEWLAFEPEHALSFANAPPHGPGSGAPGRSPDQPPPPPPKRAGTFRPRPEVQEALGRFDTERVHEPPGRRPPPHNSGPGYLHTYRTKTPLSLLYIDGLSAGKSSIGTLDSQYYILRNTSKKDGPSSGMFDEYERAKQLCTMAATEWKSKVDGFLRMELGFEIILCDFEKHLDLVSALRVKDFDDTSRRSPIYDGMFAWYRAIAARFDGIGSNRVTLNYDTFVTAYDHKYSLDLFHHGADSPPRLENLSRTALDTVKRDVDTLVLRHAPPSHPGPATTNWQAVTDMITTRYADALPYLASLPDLQSLQGNVEMLMRPFIDFHARNLTAELDRCTQHALPPPPPSSPPTLARAALTSISHRICTTLLTTLSLTPSSHRHDAFRRPLADLTAYLDWPVWRRCPRRCPYDHVCFIPIWPLGTAADRARGVGQCRNVSSLSGHPAANDYWRGPGDRLPRGPPPLS